MAASSSSLVTCQGEKFDVFISFRGADIRTGFLSHLRVALRNSHIITFVDDTLERGEEISSSLLETIERSYISVVIFSENYAFSPWCLDELVKILDCKKTIGQIILPVFYKVDPIHVQDLTGSFGAAIAKHREDFKESLGKVESWCQALKEAAELAGLVSDDIKDESELAKEIVNDISKRLNDVYGSDWHDDDGLVGIHSRVNDVKSLLCLESRDVLVIGIWGMGGVGKTTIAKKLFKLIADQFDIRCFIDCVREKSNNLIIYHLQGDILSKLPGTVNPNTALSIFLESYHRKILSRSKVILFLDDVSHRDQVATLLENNITYGPGSRIVLISRDKQVLKNTNCKRIYPVKILDKCQALRLFCLHAFRQYTPETEYHFLSREAVEYAGGIPLALKVLGSNLFGRSVEEWVDELRRLRGMSDGEIGQILRISFDGLCAYDKELFLDIACLFKWEERAYVESILGVGSKIGISRLLDKSLISEVSGNSLCMHDLIRQMGKDIVCEKTPLHKRSRLWCSKDIRIVLTTKSKVTEAIQGIYLNIYEIEDMQLGAEAFKGMYNLRFLNFFGFENKVHLPQGLKYLPHQLRLFRWHGYPLKSLPMGFCAENLVDLHLPDSELEELWNGIQDLTNLKWINLSGSKNLVRIPDLSKALNLEHLWLEGCENLVQIPSYVKYLSKLDTLFLSGCQRLRSLPGCLHSEGIKQVLLRNCREIREFPKIPCYKRHARTELEHVPSCVKISMLDLTGCLQLQSLPDSICNLKNLRYFIIDNCVNLHRLPENLGNLESLIAICASESGIKELPDSICNLRGLLYLTIEKCANLHRLPENLGNLESLKELLACESGIKELPDGICNLRGLKELDIGGCVYLHRLPENLGKITSLERLYTEGSNIRELPESIFNLKSFLHLGITVANIGELPDKLGNLLYLEVRCFDGIDCTSLELLSDWVMKQEKLREVYFVYGVNLGEDERNKMMDDVIERQWLKPIPFKARRRFCVPGNEVPQKIKYKNLSGSTLSFSGSQLKDLLGATAIYFCAVVDLNHPHHPLRGGHVLRVYMHYKGLRFPRVDMRFRFPRQLGLSINRWAHLESKHVICWSAIFKPEDDPPPHEIRFEFRFGNRPGTYCGSHVIIKCGVHPIFFYDDVIQII